MKLESTATTAVLYYDEFRDLGSLCSAWHAIGIWAGLDVSLLHRAAYAMRFFRRTKYRNAHAKLSPKLRLANATSPQETNSGSGEVPSPVRTKLAQ